jgi:hypothetical protein
MRVLQLEDSAQPETDEVTRVLNLGNLKHCQQLEVLRLFLFGSEEDALEIVGLKDAPPSLKRIECRHWMPEHALWASYYRWQMVPGWFTSQRKGGLTLSRM